MRLSIRAKLSGVIAVFVLTMVGTAGFFRYLQRTAVTTYSNVVDQNKADAELVFKLVEQAARSEELTLQLVRQVDLDAIEALVKQGEQANRALHDLAAQLGAGTGAVRKALEALVGANGQVRDALLMGQGARAVQIFIEASTPHFQALLHAVRAWQLQLQETRDAQSQQAMASLQRAQWSVFALVLLVVAVVSGLGFMATHSVSTALSSVVKQARIAASGDLRVSLAEGGAGRALARGAGQGGDELAELYQAFAEMLGNLRQLQQRVAVSFRQLEKAVGEVSVYAGELEAGAGHQSTSIDEIGSFIARTNAQVSTVVRSMVDLARTANGTSAATEELLGSIKEVAQSAETLSGTAVSTTASVDEMMAANKAVAENLESLDGLIATAATAVSQIDANTREIQSLAQDSQQASLEVRENAHREGGQALVETSGEMQRIRGSVQSLATTVDTLTSSVASIGDILTVIEDVARQTNLLALNAGILSAQLGEQGRGFAVVAHEMRALAERTSASTQDIARMIADIQQQTRQVSDLMRASVERVDVGARAVARTDQALQAIVQSAERAATMSQRIAAATDEQATGSRAASSSIQEVANRSGQISRAMQEQTQGSAQIMAAMESLRLLAEHVRQATQEQAGGADTIAAASVTSATMAEQVTASSQEGKALSDHAVAEADRIRGSTRRTLEIVTQMKHIVGAFSTLAANLRETLGQFRT